jgi:hypothetical protein
VPMSRSMNSFEDTQNIRHLIFSFDFAPKECQNIFGVCHGFWKELKCCEDQFPVSGT